MGLAGLLIVSFAAFASAQATKITAIKAGKLVDTEKGVVLENQVILIENNIIKAVGPSLAIPAGATVIDLSNSTVMPGFIDTHVHQTGQSEGNYYDTLFRQSFVDAAVTAHIYAKRTLDAGFTAVRDVGSEGFVALALKNAINAGKIPGPRMQVANYYIGSTGSHGDLVGFSPWLGSRMPEEMSGIADMRRFLLRRRFLTYMSNPQAHSDTHHTLSSMLQGVSTQMYVMAQTNLLTSGSSLRRQE